jgi:hypothetical protein
VPLTKLESAQYQQTRCTLVHGTLPKSLDMIFGVTGDHIAKLGDAEFRVLISYLCEAELRRHGYSGSEVTAGGNQDAADGGIDVRVQLPDGKTIEGFVPRANTGFQVKLPDLPPAEVIKEMKPSGRLRPSIGELAANSGAYIIASAHASLTDALLYRRVTAMRSAVRGTRGSKALTLDYYDRDRIAKWVCLHPSLVAWVRRKVGQPLTGWHPHENWSNSDEPATTDYLLDDTARLHDGAALSEHGFPVAEGIEKIRSILASPTGTVRLLGLSGTGKTRLLQALFDERIGKHALDPLLAVYTDIAESPSPSPSELCEFLIQTQRTAIVLVDNCPPEAHSLLAKQVGALSSKLSLITVEYDVRDDEPERTLVFRLEPASEDVIEKLLERRFPLLSRVDRHQIAHFSGGNARVALALANTVRRGETVCNLSNAELFHRLFRQRQEHDDTLLRAAEVCSLVYSFDVETRKGPDSELAFLAQLAGLSLDTMYRKVAELRERDLAQRRGRWRAILPALNRFSQDELNRQFLTNAPLRLLNSFTRRLGFLHDVEAARAMVKAWVSEGGWLSDIQTNQTTKISALRNVAPVDPELTLSILERRILGSCASNEDRRDFTHRSYAIGLCKALAYDAELFPRAAYLLAILLSVESGTRSYESAKGAFSELFHFKLSGTKADVHQRLAAVRTLLSDLDKDIQQTGLVALNAMLQTSLFNALHSFEFGAHSRDYGWWPRSKADRDTWFSSTIDFMKALGVDSSSPNAEAAKTILGQEFRSLWHNIGNPSLIEMAASEIAEHGFWMAGWIGIKTTERLDRKSLSGESRARLQKLEERLRPTNLLDTCRSYVLSKPWSSLDIADSEEGEPMAGHLRTIEHAEALGQEVAENKTVLEALISDIAAAEGGRGFPFGRGLARGASDLRSTWSFLTAQLLASDLKPVSLEVLQGFIAGCETVDPTLAGKLLDEALEHAKLGRYFPFLQGVTPLNCAAIGRLLKALTLRRASPHYYRQLTYGRKTDEVSAADMAAIISGVAGLEDGRVDAVDMFAMHIHPSESKPVIVGPELIECGRALLLLFDYSNDGRDSDYDLTKIAEACIIGPESKDTAAALAKHLYQAFQPYGVHIYSYKGLLRTIFSAQPGAALDTFFGDDTSGRIEQIIMIMDDVRGRDNPLSGVPVDVLIAWAKRGASKRFLTLTLPPLFNPG